jgi:hypothetical protein
MAAVAHNPAFAKKVGIPTKVGKEFDRADKKVMAEGGGVNAKRMKDGGVSLAVGRGEKLPTKQGAGLTQKGRDKYNRETGSHLKAPQPQGGSRKDSFCARMSGVVKHASGEAPRAKASLKRWKCPGF